MFNPVDHPHRRFNPLTGQYVLVSPHRAKRPWQGQVEKISQAPSQSHDPDCFLCAGNKRVTGDQNPDYRDTFVFTNDFAALMQDTPAAGGEQDPLLKLEAARGTSRVICFSPDHGKTLPELPLPEGFPQRIYITFDVDAFDASLMPATGTPSPGGLSWREAQFILERCVEGRQVVGLDVVELAPIAGLHHCDFTAAKLTHLIMGLAHDANHKEQQA